MPGAEPRQDGRITWVKPPRVIPWVDSQAVKEWTKTFMPNRRARLRDSQDPSRVFASSLGVRPGPHLNGGLG